MRKILTLSLVLALAGPAFGDPAPARDPFSSGESAFRDAKARLLREYVDQGVSEDDLYRGAVAGMLAAGGRKWDVLLSPTDLANLKSDMSGQIAGIGIEIDVDAKNGFLSVLGVFPGSPAARAGLTPGDRIIKIDGRRVKGADADAAARTIRGPIGTPITLSILRDDDVVVKTIKRASIVVATVTERMLPGQVALIWVRAFNDKTTELLRAALTKVAAAHPRGLVLDLRENMGGLFDPMIACAGMLLPRGTLVVTEVERGKRHQAIRTTTDPILQGVPITVLADGSTASGAEILAGALRDGLGARIVGARTHGKWNVQKIADLPNGYAMKYTVGLFQTPKGLSPDGKGINPDVPVDLDEETVAKVLRIHDAAQRIAADAQLRAALALLK